MVVRITSRYLCRWVAVVDKFIDFFFSFCFRCARKYVLMRIFFIYRLSSIGLSETAVMDLIANNLQQQRNMVEQLRREANIQRMPVSQACADIVKYVTEHEQEDCLLVGFSTQKTNPFREKSSCQII